MWQGLQHHPTPTPANAASVKRTTAVRKICIFMLVIGLKTFSMIECIMHKNHL